MNYVPYIIIDENEEKLDLINAKIKIVGDGFLTLDENKELTIRQRSSNTNSNGRAKFELTKNKFKVLPLTLSISKFKEFIKSRKVVMPDKRGYASSVNFNI